MLDYVETDAFLVVCRRKNEFMNRITTRSNFKM